MMADDRERPNREAGLARLRGTAAPRMTPTVGQYLTHWLANVKPALEPATYAYYETMARLYIGPALGSIRLDRLQTRDVQNWLDRLASTCQCCAQGKDAARRESRRCCCAAGACCGSYSGRRTVQAARDTLRAALNHAKASDELVPRNVASYARVPDRPSRRRTGPVWSVEQTSRFLASARDDGDPFYAAHVLIVVNALPKGEVLGLTWPSVDTDGGEVDTSWQLQRVGTQLIHKQRATTGEPAARTLPIPEICSAALKLRREEQAVARERAGNRWQDSDLVFTTRWGTPIEPRNFNRSFDSRCAQAGVPRIGVRETRHTCASLLAALDVHPAIAMQILRHAHIAMTTEAETQVPDEITRAALKKLSDGPDSTPPAQRDQP